MKCSGMVSLAWAKWTAERLYLLADTIYRKGNHNLAELKVDVCLGLNMHVKWNKGGWVIELKFPSVGTLIVLGGPSRQGWRGLAKGIVGMVDLRPPKCQFRSLVDLKRPKMEKGEHCGEGERGFLLQAGFKE